MLIATIPVLHRVYTFEKSLKITVSSGIALLLLLVAFSTWHCVTDEIAGHNVLFGTSLRYDTASTASVFDSAAGTMICLVGFQTRSIVKARVADPLVRSEVGRLVNRATSKHHFFCLATSHFGIGKLIKVVVFGTGYGIWIIDNIFCGFLTQTKRSIGMPWSFLLELHGWWHIFTGVGAYCREYRNSLS
jgi:dihydroceramidase